MYEGMYVGRQVGTHVCMCLCVCVFELTGASEHKAVGSYLNSIHEFPIKGLLKRHEINIDYFQSRHAMNKKLQLYQSVEEHFTKILTRR